MSFSVLLRDFLIGELVFRIDALHNRADDRFETLMKELEKMAQAINDRLDRVDAAIENERQEVTARVDTLVAEVHALKEQVQQGQIDEAEFVRRLDHIEESAKNIYTAPPADEPPVEPNPVV